MEFRTPIALFLLCLVKKLTVMGIIGNTHGVSKAAKPPRKAKIKIDHKLFDFSDETGFSTAVLLLFTSGVVVSNAVSALVVSLCSTFKVSSTTLVIGIAKLKFLVI